MNAISFQEPAAGDDARLEKQLDELVLRACGGDRRAIGAIALTFGPELLDTARAALGEEHAQDAADVLQDFFLSMLEGHRFVPAPGRTVAWMHAIVRAIGARFARGDGP